MALQDPPSSPDSIPGEKTKKYDRQLRLWGDHGQVALETAKVCLINATATGTEIMKNLILPGIGSFTIVDGSKVRGEDVGNNFFLDSDSIGKPRAQVACELLLELNEDVNGDFVEESAEALLENNPLFFNNFSIVVATDLVEKTLLNLSRLLWEAEVPLLVCRSYGFIGYLRLVLKEHTVIESHPDSAHEDLRLDRPFPGLIHFCNALNMGTMTSKEHSHTPWLVIIFKHLQVWKQQHNGELPKNYKEKSQLKEMIRDGIRKNSEGVPEDEENFDEAIKNVNTALVPTRIPSEVQEVFDHENCIHLHSESKPFWILARAVKEFVNKEGGGVLPLRGSIPDMTSDSERYIELQNVYKSQAGQDIAVVSNYVHHFLQSLGRDEPMSRPPRSPSSSPREPQDGITNTDIKTFCKNASFLRIQNCRSMGKEYMPSTAKVEELAMHLEDQDDDDVVFYVLLRAVAKFQMEFKRYPGYDTDALEVDILHLKTCASKFLQELGITQAIRDDFIHEFCRYGASELHSVAAFMGGVAAQEVIKVVTGQFVPINNTYIYNAMKQTSATVQL